MRDVLFPEGGPLRENGTKGDSAARPARCLATMAHDACVRTLLSKRYANDPEASVLALALYEKTGSVAGVESPRSFLGTHVGDVDVLPALPIGEYRHHLAWVLSSLEAFATVLQQLGRVADKPIAFRVTQLPLRFYRTERARFPSAYFVDGSVAYNVHGELHDTEVSSRETLMHELFHLNDARESDWSEGALGPIYDHIALKCHGSDACLRRYAPHETRVAGGTFYAFHSATGSVAEYGAELAIRYYREQRARIVGIPMKAPPFKCRAPENLAAWNLLAETFFGGADLVPPCVVFD